MAAPESPQAPEPAPPAGPSRFDRFIHVLRSWRTLILAVAGLIVAISALGAAIHPHPSAPNTPASNGGSSPPAGSSPGNQAPVGNQSSVPAGQTTPPSSPPVTIPAESVDLSSALLPASALGQNATAKVTPDASGITELCGGPLRGAASGRSEWLTDNTTGTQVGETIVEFPDTAGATQLMDDGRQNVGGNNGCSVAAGSSTWTFRGDLPGSVPASCVDPGKYFKALAQWNAGDLFQGYFIAVQCGRWTISVTAVSSSIGVATDAWVSGVMNNALGQFRAAQKP